MIQVSGGVSMADGTTVSSNHRKKSKLLFTRSVQRTPVLKNCRLIVTSLLSDQASGITPRDSPPLWHRRRFVFAVQKPITDVLSAPSWQPCEKLTSYGQQIHCIFVGSYTSLWKNANGPRPATSLSGVPEKGKSLFTKRDRRTRRVLLPAPSPVAISTPPLRRHRMTRSILD